MRNLYRIILITVTLKIFSFLREKFGFIVREITCDTTFNSFLLECKKMISTEFVETFFDSASMRPQERYVILVNGTNFLFLSSNWSLKNGDIISIFPPAAGG